MRHTQPIAPSLRQYRNSDRILRFPNSLFRPCYPLPTLLSPPSRPSPECQPTSGIFKFIVCQRSRDFSTIRTNGVRIHCLLKDWRIEGLITWGWPSLMLIIPFNKWKLVVLISLARIIGEATARSTLASALCHISTFRLSLWACDKLAHHC